MTRYTRLAGLVEAVKRSKEIDELHESYERNMRKVVSVRLDAADIYTLEAVAKEMGVTRTAAAQEILETAISEVAEAFGISHFAFEMVGDADGRVTVSADGKPALVVQDDALIIGGGEEK